MTRGRALGLLAALLLVVAAWIWREPVELWLLRDAEAGRAANYLARHPNSPAARAVLADAYFRAGRASYALGLLSQVPDRYPTDAALRVRLARAQMETGDMSAAYGHLQVVLRTLKPGDVEAGWWLGQLLERSGRADEAYDQYSQLIARHPHHTGALLRLGSLALVDGRMSVAEEFFRRAAAADRKNAEAAAQHAQVLFRLGRAEEAAGEARRAVQLAPDSAKANFWLARSLMTLDTPKNAMEAEAAFRKAIASGEDRATSRYFLAKLLRDTGRTADALAQLQINVSESPLHKDSYYDLALCAQELRQPERAETAMQKFRRLQLLDEQGTRLEQRVFADPGNLNARLELGTFYLGHSRPDLAAREAQWVLRQQPGHPAARRLEAEIAARGRR